MGTQVLIKKLETYEKDFDHVAFKRNDILGKVDMDVKNPIHNNCQRNVNNLYR